MILIKDAVLDGKRCDIFINGGLIDTIKVCGDNCEEWQNNILAMQPQIIEAAGKYVIPGFVNMHTHSAMTLMRGLCEDEMLQTWIDAIWKVETRLDDELIYWGTKLACVEMLKSGTTTFNDQYWRIDVAKKAVDEMGLRGIHSYIFLNHFDKELAEKQKRDCIEKYELFASEKKTDRFAISVHAIYTVDADTIKWASDFAREHNLLLHVHLAETQKEYEDSLSKYGMTPTAYLESLDVLGPEVLAAHCVWLSPQDIEIMAKHNVKAVHNVNSNLKLASGYKFKYQELRDAGVTVCIGTDGAASSNNLDMLESLKTSALLQKAWRRDPKAMPLNELMDCATINGAKALRLNTGVIAPGYAADLCLVDVNNYAFTPNINFLANLIYSANSSCIDTVICNGKVVMNGRKVEGEREIYENVNRVFRRLL